MSEPESYPTQDETAAAVARWQAGRAPMLSAAEVAAIGQHMWMYSVPSKECRLVDQLVAQDARWRESDARWRALVGECLNTMRRLDWGDGWRNRHGVEYCVCPACGALSWNGHAAECWLAAQIAQAQAALDGAAE